jgi:hypothetical protein
MTTPSRNLTTCVVAPIPVAKSPSHKRTHRKADFKKSIGIAGADCGTPQALASFPKQRKEPLTDAQHVRNAVARFDQVIDVSDADRALAFANIQKAANYYGVSLTETSWHDLVPRKRRAQS